MFDLDNLDYLFIVFFIFVFSLFNFISTAIIIKYYSPQHQQNNNVKMFNKEDVDHLLENQKNEIMMKKTIELEETNSKLNNEIQVQAYKFNALRVRAESRLDDASEQLSEIKKVAKKEILSLRLKLKDSQSKLALKKKQYDDMAKSSVEFFSNAPICNSYELSNHFNDNSTSNGPDKSSPICPSSSSSLNSNSCSTSDSSPLSLSNNETDNLKK
ncbi:hypothetical protein DICPUDRAFT_152850 [Dictyostelium purpureum]|uniref:Uncharacterized protein n=1 Tax=Dictyostelium purpureum TaxID=5786 RepID=F0ZMF5_DICPU|nr:uncharacterized protein DICPUDRAFT_152850 [Dictyostelium purpureum]EGC34845.1 hypothetical protein DICPUDRAFT_152850 [Dictyostelium purpureum]|eukprot:XP_003288599.1 hypothetical protein DICPUDRAFT_152850 [Dictyostelium purpureum]